MISSLVLFPFLNLGFLNFRFCHGMAGEFVWLTQFLDPPWVAMLEGSLSLLTFFVYRRFTVLEGILSTRWACGFLVGNALPLTLRTQMALPVPMLVVAALLYVLVFARWPVLYTMT